MKEYVKAEGAPAPVGPYSQAVKAGDMVFFSGQIPIDPKTGKMVEGGIEEQAERALENLKAVIEASGCSLDDVVKVNIYLADIADFGKVNSVYERYFGASKPARAAVGGLSLPLGAKIEIEAVAVKG